MTFEIKFNHNETLYKADVTLNGRDFLVNLTTPTLYETAPTMAFTIHNDETMNYDNRLFDDKQFMPAIENAIKNYIHAHQIKVA